MDLPATNTVHSAIAENGGFSLTDVFSMSGPFSTGHAIVFFFVITYSIAPIVFGFLWALTRPSDWVYKYMWAFMYENLIAFFRLHDNGLNTQLRRQHIDEYGHDLRYFWPRVWFYTLPLNCLLAFWCTIA